MTSITVDVSEAVKKLDPKELEYALASSLKGASALIANDLRKYPPQSHKPMKWKSAKQRRGFFAKLRAGEIDVPYRRGQSPGSEKLGASWSRKVIGRGTGNIGIEIGTRVSYARYVQDEDNQAAYHKGNWNNTIQFVARDREDEVVAMFKKALARWAR